ncbi:hypothetical protein RHSIM_RhsimUnG0074500 [Rhododendron simsii]|uniref:Uncharacterized protein n=1 Tax=Rhododendron simsii TaxID=118357 RepID=A0A834FW96_RHOSS|nr:hypothetical protein RHSIM_RhsimUnG0074500 [Rhododendron simsii]
MMMRISEVLLRKKEDRLLPWDMFCENVGRSLVDDSSSALKQMAIQLVKECHCHLLAIVLLARALKDVTDISVWELALQKLSSHSSAMEEGSSQVMKHVLELIWDQKDLTTKYCIQYCTSRCWKQRWGSPARGFGLTKTPTVEKYTKEVEFHDNELSELPENPECPALRKLWLQNNCNLMEIPQLFFEDMPLLVYLDLSHTSIKSLPPSISRLVWLQTFYLRGCELLNELPPHIGAFQKLEVFDLEGTEIIYWPKEIGELISLRHFKVSLCRHADYYTEPKQTSIAIPTEVLSLFPQLEELSIDVSPDGEWWDDDVNPDSDWWDVNAKAILNALSSSNKKRILSLYLPSVELLQQIKFRNLIGFRFIVGCCPQCIIYRPPHAVEERFNIWEKKKFKKCLKYIKGEGMPSGITEALKHASLLFLDRHWTVKVLSEFGHENLADIECCLLVECNELQTIVAGDYECPSGGDNKRILQCLRHLSIHYMKNLESIWQGSIPNNSLFSLTFLTLHTCPNLTTIFTLDMLGNLGLLKELIVEDCPKIRSLVTRADANVSGHFCQSLRKIALLDLPQLVTISGPLCHGEEVDSLFVYNCPMLKSLDTAETSPKYCKIVGEKEWWDSLRWHDSDWSRLTQPTFEELRTDEDFMDQLIMVASWKALVTRDWEKANGDLKPRNCCCWPTAEYISKSSSRNRQLSYELLAVFQIVFALTGMRFDDDVRFVLRFHSCLPVMWLFPQSSLFIRKSNLSLSYLVKLGAVHIHPCSVAAKALSIPPLLLDWLSSGLVETFEEGNSMLDDLIKSSLIGTRIMAFEIAAHRDLKVFDLEDTEILHLPIEIGEPTMLRCFRASLCAGANHYSNVTLCHQLISLGDQIDYHSSISSISRLDSSMELKLNFASAFLWP